MLVLLFTAIVTARLERSCFRQTATDRAMAACAVWFVVLLVSIGHGRNDPYDILNGIVVLTAYSCCRVIGTAFLLPTILVSGLVQSGIAFAQWTGIAASRHFYYDLTGSFPNPGPLGGWLCAAALAAVMLTVRAWKNGHKTGCALYAAAGVCVGIVLWLTDSRAAWTGFAAGIFCLLAVSNFRHKRAVLLLSGAVGCIGMVLLYRYKPGSADGRLLIWRVSAEMIARHPIRGGGIGSFSERYMFAQADYFERHPDSRFIAVAEQVGYPFNESVGTICEQGMVGGLLVLLLLGTAFWCPADHSEGRVLLAGLVLFGQFSYPSAFLAFGLLFAAVLASAANASPPVGRPLSGRTVCGTGVAALVGGAVLLPGLYRAGATGRNRYTLRHEISVSMRRNDPADLPRLERLARRLPIADLYSDLGDRWLETGRIEQAKNCYRQAARMIPSRWRPYDGLWRAYRKAEQTDSAIGMARYIAALPVKIGNTTTIRIGREVEEWLDSVDPHWKESTLSDDMQME